MTISTGSSAYFLLDERIQRFIWAEGWESLRDVQETAIPLIVQGEHDVLISAATASGKTEAAFFPALTAALKSDPPGLIIYVSPLKALINDQFGRLNRLCEDLDCPVWPWHGDISSSRKARFAKEPRGVLLITPESLEAILCNRGSAAGALFRAATFVVVDELHSFIGTERGKQLQSLLHRIELAIGRRVSRIGLSATLGDMSLAQEFLRPGHGSEVKRVDSRSDESTLLVSIRGYEEPAVLPTEDPPLEREEQSPAQVCADLFRSLRGTNNLVFPNSRREVERYTHLLNRACSEAGVPTEFWPHHGSLSAEIRNETEAALKNREMPATAICTNTLELGIDIGAVKCVAQIGPPPSVASLRQRLGRSGRRKGEPSMLRGYAIEAAIQTNSTLHVLLRECLVQTIATVELLIERWFEPPRPHGTHYSTLVQQVLALIAERGGATIGTLFSALCGQEGPFRGIDKDSFVELIRHLGQRELLMQDSSGVLLHGRVGEKFVNHYSFYAAFSTDEEFRIVTSGRTLGSLPLSNVLLPGQHILFAGRTWLVESIEEEKKVLFVVPSPGGRAPQFDGGRGRVHTRVRRRMRELLARQDVPTFLDPVATRLLAEARAEYQRLDLANRVTLSKGSGLMLMTWLGDAANEALLCLLARRGITAENLGVALEVTSGGTEARDVLDLLIDAASEPAPPPEILLAQAKNLQRERWDWALPESLLQRGYASLSLDVDEALSWARTL